MFFFRPAILFLLVAACCPLATAARNLGYAIHPSHLESSISRLAIEDFKHLLDSAQREAPAMEWAIVIELPQLRTQTAFSQDFASGRNYPYFPYPDHGYSWTASNGIDFQSLTLHASTPNGIANGLYALLQERLGFRFIHPRQTIIPRLTNWPIPGEWTFEGRPGFDKKGFHLHTMHPLELTQPLHDPKFPGGMEMIQEYIVWLARNGQNYFDFCLMEDVDQDLAGWAAHAGKFTRFAHDRGILAGLDLSLHMVQQKAFKLVEFFPADLRKAEIQVRERLRLLMQANWDFLNLEFAIAEFVGGMEGFRDRMRAVVLEEMERYPGTKLIGRQHVVKPEDEIGGRHDESSLNVPDSDKMGLLVHTVMCYALDDPYVPVYELDNFDHLMELLIQENKTREVWYYPESAYWVTFDNSVPMLLLPYLSARWRDIQTVKKEGIPGHLTFSSGWEWGYWMVDWSIARWSWEYSLNGKPIPTTPTAFIEDLLPHPDARHAFRQSMHLMERSFIAENLIQHLCPTAAPDEFPKPFNPQFQPRTPWHITDLRHKDMQDTLVVLRLTVQVLRSLADSLENFADRIQQPFGEASIAQEIAVALTVTADRLQHRAALYEALIARGVGDKNQFKEGLLKADGIRTKAIGHVREMEARFYRYPVPLLAGRYDSYTAYDFGYLYPVHDLNFWRREEMQVKTGRKSPFYRNIFDLAKIGGIKN